MTPEQIHQSYQPQVLALRALVDDYHQPRPRRQWAMEQIDRLEDRRSREMERAARATTH